MASQPHSFSPEDQLIIEAARIRFANGEQPGRHPSLGPVAEKCTGDDAFDAIHAPNAFAKELKLRKEVAEYRRSIGLDAPEPAPDT